jgi:hypothetical protein
MEKEQSADKKSSHIAWHPAFIEALQMELEGDLDALEFHPEFQLTSEPLKIDCVIVKKTKDVVLKKNIAAIFREWNLLEYKSPDDYVSVTDFYKVYGYACLYASLEEVPITSLTISFVESHYPEKLIKHLQNDRKFTVEKIDSGIYNIVGDIIPIQVIDSRMLSSDENLWLKSLDNRLDTTGFINVSIEAYRYKKIARLGAYLDVITRANPLTLKEVINMETALTVEKVFEEAGWIARWEARGKAEEALTIAKNMMNLGFPIETIVSATQLKQEIVQKLFQ